MYSGGNEIFDGRFEHGMLPMDSRVKIMLQNGTYYEGAYSNHRRHGLGVCFYPNGDKYEGNFTNDKRIGRAKMKFVSGITFTGQFIND